ncbi:macrophage mannose receptor 1-like protein [Aphelenchoides avenae]|nr:macrophage mannose receptor 1-like protein [Aphelenchus avenae]
MVGWLVWDDARSACARRYANLASIHSDAENDWITDFLHQNVGPTDNGAAAIGLHDTTGKCAFQWIDGSPVNYFHWNTGQPSNCGVTDWRRVLVVFNPDGYMGVAFRRWMSYPATWGIYAVCEKAPVP